MIQIQLCNKVVVVFFAIIYATAEGALGPPGKCLVILMYNEKLVTRIVQFHFHYRYG